MGDVSDGFIIGLLVAGLFFLCLKAIFLVGNSEVISGKVFKISDATYQCRKINELEYEK
jgi:hypothetical protein